VVTPMQGARERAEQFVLAWFQSDYEPDDVDPRWMSERSIDKLVERVTQLFSGQTLRAPIPSGKSTASARLAAGVITIGTPQEVSRDCLGEPGLRAPECIAYSLCLDHCLMKGWAEFTCRGCKGPGVAASHQRLEPGEPPKETYTPDNPRSGVQLNPDGTPLG